MKDSKPYIIVAQTHQTSLDFINRLRSDRGPNQIYTTTNSGEVLKLVADGGVDIVVTGEYFYDALTKTMLPQEVLTYIVNMVNTGGVERLVAEYTNCKTGPSNGIQLAAQVYANSPQTLVFSYSVMPNESIFYAGYIRKEPSILANLLDSNLLKILIENGDLSGFEKNFPEINFSSGWKKQRERCVVVSTDN